MRSACHPLDLVARRLGAWRRRRAVALGARGEPAGVGEAAVVGSGWRSDGGRRARPCAAATAASDGVRGDAPGVGGRRGSARATSTRNATTIRPISSGLDPPLRVGAPVGSAPHPARGLEGEQRRRVPGHRPRRHRAASTGAASSATSSRGREVGRAAVVGRRRHSSRCLPTASGAGGCTAPTAVLAGRRRRCASRRRPRRRNGQTSRTASPSRRRLGRAAGSSSAGSGRVGSPVTVIADEDTARPAGASERLAIGRRRRRAMPAVKRNKSRRRPIFPKGCPLSIFGAGELNFRVRDGNGCGLSARVTGLVCVW